MNQSRIESRIDSPRFPRLTRIRATLSLTLCLCGLALLGTGCESGDRQGRSNSPAISPQTRDQDARLIIGPSIAREFGYRVKWQFPVAGKNLKHLSVQFDSVFTLDEDNYLTRIDRADGTRVWRIPVSYPLAEIQGINYLPSYGKVLVTSGGDLFVLNASDGSQIARQKMQQVANTEPVTYGEYLIYGSRNGQLIWHSHSIAFQAFGYQIARSINVAPVVYSNAVVTVGNDGEIMVLSAGSANQFWRKKLLDGISAPPVVGNGAIYIAGQDQYVWAFDLNTGRNLWKYLAASPLTESPVLIDNHVFQHIRDEGLICFEALPDSRPGGEITWSASAVTGNVLTKRRENLITWDGASRTLNVLTAQRGGEVNSIQLPLVDRMICTGVKNGEIYAADSAGHVIKLIPRN